MFTKVQNIRYVAATAFLIFCLLCAIFAIFMLPEDQSGVSDHRNPHKSRLVHVWLGPLRHPSKSPSVEGLGLKLKQMFESSMQAVDLASESDDDYDDDADDNDEYEDEDENKVFAEGDFDYAVTNVSRDGFALSVVRIGNRIESDVEIKNAQQLFRIKFVEALGVNQKSPKMNGLKVRNVSMVNFEGVPVVEDKLFWSKDLEENTPKGISDSDVGYTLHRLRQLQVQKVQQPTWNLCGRPKNVFLVFEDGSKACARYRAPHQYLVQGEVLSFYLARLLSITNVPVVSLVSSDVHHDRWSRPGVRSDVLKSDWKPNTTVAFIQWIDDLERDKMPRILLSALLNKTTLHSHTSSLFDLSVEELVELLQWSDLILFDYLTGNYDRVASMQDAADKEKKPSILNDTIHNLVKSKTTKSLWLIDNESGLLDSYSLMYGRLGKDGRFLNFHRQLLNSLCLFRRSTAERIQRLHRTDDPAKILLDFVRENEPLLTQVDDVERLSTRLRERIREVHNHITRCKTDF